MSIIIPVRNEEANLEAVLASLEGQEGRQEIIVVDDQSDDRTGEILARLQEAYPGVIALPAGDMPAGWTGKNYALDCGSQRAQGEILLFTDADTRHAPGSLRHSIEQMEQHNIDLYSLSPVQQVPTFWERATIPFIYVQLTKRYSFAKVNDPHSDQAAANGQYLMIRRSVYQSLGGHRAVRREMLEDVALARRAKQAGYRLRFSSGQGRVSTRMYRSFRELWLGWTKNLYLLFGGAPFAVSRVGLRVLVLDVAPGAAFLMVWTLFLLHPSNTVALAFSLALFLCVALRQGRYEAGLRGLGFAGGLSAYYSLGATLFVLLLIHSAWTYLTGGKIRWKSRSYPASRT